MELVVLCADSAWWGLAGRLGYHVNTQPSAREYEERRAARDETERILLVIAEEDGQALAAAVATALVVAVS